MPRFDVVCIGSATVDNFLTLKQKFSSIKSGDKVLVNSLERHSGGGATNSAAALSKMGLKVKILTKLGNDHDAEFVLKELKDYKIKNICRKSSKKNTDFATLLASNKEKDRIILVHKGASRDLVFSDFKKLQLRAKWIYLASLMGKSFSVAKDVANYAKKKKIKLLFNPSLYLAKKGKNFLKPILQATKILVLNKEEAQALLNNKTNSFKTLLFGLSKLGPEIVVITDGSKKLYAIDGRNIHSKNMYSLQPPKVKIIHTAGSGDAFTAGFLSGIIKRYYFDDCLKIGQANASSVIQHIGTKNKLLNEREAKQMIDKHKIKVDKISVGELV